MQEPLRLVPEKPRTTTIQTNGCMWIILVWMLCALTFCGDPDLQDALVSRIHVSECP